MLSGCLRSLPELMTPLNPDLPAASLELFLPYHAVKKRMPIASVYNQHGFSDRLALEFAFLMFSFLKVFVISAGL